MWNRCVQVWNYQAVLSVGSAPLVLFLSGMVRRVTDRKVGMWRIYGRYRNKEERRKFVIFFVILVVVVIAIAVSNSSNKKKQEEEYQKVKADVASAVQPICRLLEALDILESVLKTHDEKLRFYRDIGPSLKTDDTVFELQYIIIRSGRNPAVSEHLNSIIHERGMRISAKKSGKPLSTMRSPHDDAVWYDLPDEQIEMLYDMTIDLDERRDDDNDIILEGALPLRFYNPSSRAGYIAKANMYVKALAEGIHAKIPAYGFEASTYGIHFNVNPKDGVVSYKDI